MQILQPPSDYASQPEPWQADEPEDRSWAWVLYPLGILALLAFIYACTQAYVALDAVFG